jgi:hypothetical protein
MAEDWIDRLKKDQGQDADRARDETKLRLHIADVIKAKMPVFWSLLTTNIGTYCAKLRQTYPSDMQYHCTLNSVTSNSFRLINTIPPRVCIAVCYSESGQYIEIQESGQQTAMDDFAPRRMETLNIKTTDDEDITIAYRQEPITYPAKLAEHLCRRVAQISS